MPEHSILTDQIDNVIYIVTIVSTSIAGYTTYIWRKAKKVVKHETFDEQVESTLINLETILKKLCDKLDKETKASQKTHEELVKTASKIEADVSKLQGEMSIMKKLILKSKNLD